MYNELRAPNDILITMVLDRSQELFHIFMGKHPNDIEFADMMIVWLISGYHISNMCNRTMKLTGSEGPL